MSISSICAALAASVLALLPAMPSSAAGRVITISHWHVVCGKGTDEFAVDCKATAAAAGMTITLQTGDSQLYATVDGSCSRTGQSDNWWRDELVGLSTSERRRTIEASLNRSVAQIGKACGPMHDLKVMFSNLPDIAVRGAP